MVLTYTLIFLPVIMAASLFICISYYKKKITELEKKQKIALMACNAKQSLIGINDFPDTYITDSQIKIRFLAKNGIDVDTALSNMNGNINQYNDSILSFVGESQRVEDELFNLLQQGNMLQYGARIHQLRVKANMLGILNLTDTAFFHEIEAYGNNPDIVRLNWEKLSFELDEACDNFTRYIKSLGVKDGAIDENGNKITFKKWGEQLQEAFTALEMYDTDKAKNILNNLLRYHIDSDITKNIESIISNIDEIMNQKNRRFF
ncbi:MAG: hypothetical protein IIW54_12335 [Lachnospiraceae bacterium]|nr:hypothetical protein [Lachnospiraceae bacterium]MBQ2405625.1 hypothetical protein [Lachnospiraceae bacterium]MBQ5851578.1 hypothetical protein [Lachnospiraceae bacterium]MEE0918745.1 hypothetical protein [Lachnospiraceae bacterium]